MLLLSERTIATSAQVGKIVAAAVVTGLVEVAPLEAYKVYTVFCVGETGVDVRPVTSPIP